MSRELLDKLIDLLEQIDTPMVEDEATIEQLQALQYYAACLEEWARIGLETKGAPLIAPTDFPPDRD